MATVLSATTLTNAYAEELSLQGFSGLLAVPHAGVLAESVVDIQYNNDLESSASTEFRDQSIENLIFGVGLLPAVELTARISATRDKPSRREDLLTSLKLRVWDRDGLRVALGVSDVSGNAKFESYYGTVDYRWKSVLLAGGYGSGGGQPGGRNDFLSGPFAGAAIRVLSGLSILAEYDTEAFNAGVKYSSDLSQSVSVYAIGKASSSDLQSTSLAAGLQFQLGDSATVHPRRWSKRNQPSDTDQEKRRPLLVRTTQSPSNSLSSYFAAAERLSSITELTESRLGTTVRGFDATGGKWAAWLDQPWSQLSDGSHAALELRVDADLPSVVASEFGTFDYSLALRPAFRAQGPLGIGAYVSYELPVSNSSDVEQGRVYDDLLHRRGLYQRAIQWAVHPLPGLFVLSTWGLTEVDEVDYEMNHYDAALHLAEGRHQVRVAFGDFVASDQLNFADRDTKVLSYRYWWEPLNLFVRLSRGEYFFGDKGTRADAYRYFGDVTVGVFFEQNEDDESFGGIAVSIPLLANPARFGRVQAYGDARFRYSVKTRLNGDGGNALARFGAMLEPLPQYDLIDDLLDGDRAFPAYSRATVGN